jgi:gliding motility-associated-like protein
MISQMNYTDSSTPSLAKAARFPLLRALLAGFVLLLLGSSQQAMAAPGHSGKEDGKPAYTYTVTVIKDYSVAGSGNPDILQITVSPVPPNPPGLSLTFNISTASYTPILTTDANGVVTLDFASTIVGPVTVEVYNGIETPANLVATQVLNFIAAPGPVDPSNSYIQVIQNPANADGVSQDIVEAVLYDAHGNPENSNTPVTFAFTGVASTMSTTGLSVGNIVTATFTSTNVGNDQVTASVPAGLLHDLVIQTNQFVNIQFVVPPPSLANSYITAVTTPMPADGTSQDVVQAVVLNSLGQPVPAGTAVTFTIETGTATITTTGITNASGVATAFFTSTVIGSVQVQAQVSIGGVPTFLNDQSNPTNNFVTIQFVVIPPSVANSYITAVTTPEPADGTSQDVVQAVVLTSSGQPVAAGTAVTFTIETGTATITTTGITNASGVATAYFTSTVVGSVQVQAQVSISGVPTFLNDQNNPANNYVTVQFVIPPPSVASSFVVAVTTPVLADGTSQDVVQAVVLNSLGQPVPAGTAVTFTIETGTATITTTGITDASGVATAYFTSTVVGSVQVQAQVSVSGVPTYLNDQNNPANNYVTIAFVTGPPVPSNPSNPVPPGGGGGSGGSGTGPSNPSDPSGPGGGFTYLAMTFNNVPADGVSADTATAYITDAQGHPVAGVAVTFTFHTGGPANSGASFQPGGVVTIVVTTNANGYAAVPITSTVQGDAWIDASINPGGTIAGSSAIAHFTDTPDLTNPQTQLIVIVYEALADGHSTTQVKAHVVDHSGQPMADVAVQFTIDSGTAVITTPQPVTTDANGDAYIQLTSTTPGNVLVTATIGGQPITFGSPAKTVFAAINIYVPRVFSPNNDGTNDVLKPILVGISTFHYFSVYNRWGNLIFTSQDPNQGWDGTFKGVAQPVETYLWIAEGIDLNGKKIVAKGMTSLVR